MLQCTSSRIFELCKPDVIDVPDCLDEDLLEDLVAEASNSSIRVLVGLSDKKHFEKIKKIYLKYPSICIAVYPNVIDDEVSLEATSSLSKSNILFLDLPLCIASYFNIQTTLNYVLDLQYDASNASLSKIDAASIIKPNFIKFREACLQCPLAKKCCGCSRSSTSFVKEFVRSLKDLNSLNKDINYTSVKDFLYKSIEIKSVEFNPRDPNKSTQFMLNAINSTRYSKESFKEGNFYNIYSPTESIIFNKCESVSEDILKEDISGLMSINWQFIGKDTMMDWRERLPRNALVPSSGIAVVSRIDTSNNTFFKRNIDFLENFTLNTVMKAINDPRVTCDNNALFFNGRKFLGREIKHEVGVGFTESTVITCSYVKDKVDFDKLYQWEGRKPVTGITDELPYVTREFLINALQEAALTLQNFL